MTPRKFSRDVLLFGSERLVPESEELKVGPLTFVIQDGAIRYITLGDNEIVRRIYMALRDQNWNTIPTRYYKWEFHELGNSIDVTFDAESRQDEIDFRWKGTIRVDGSGKLSYSMSGEAHSNFKKRVIGLCILFPIEEFAGGSCTVVKSDLSEVRTSFPLFISSEQPLPGFEDVREIRYALKDGTALSVAFEGDVFEMEDQRGFTDGSYKVYSTYTRSIDPDNVVTGEKAAQSITVSITATEIPKDRQTLAPVVLTVDTTESIPLPNIGLGAASHDQPFTSNEIGLIKNMKLSHLRGDLDLTSENWRSVLNRLCDQAKKLDLSLELAVFLGRNPDSEFGLLKRELDKLKPLINSLLIFDKGEMVTKPESIARARQFFENYPSHPKIGGATNRNFFDLHFAHPSMDPGYIISYSANPQVHAHDVSSMMETLEGQSWTIRTAHEIFEQNPIVVSPITLKPRFNPDEIVPEKSDPNELPSQVDPRQMSLFGASWTAGSIKSLAESNAYSLTYYETTGWRGVVETQTGSKFPEKFFSEPGMVFPLYHVLADVSEMSGGVVYPVRSSQPLAANALAIRNGSTLRVVLYNLTWGQQGVSLVGLPANKGRIKRLNEQTASEAMFEPAKFREASEPFIFDREQLSLSPYEVVTLDFDFDEDRNH